MGKPHLNTVYGNRVIGSNPVPRFAPPPPLPNQLLYSNRQETEWELSANTNAGITVTIPNGFQYIVGLNHLRIMVDGVTAAPSKYTEIGYYADWSNKISFTVPLCKGQIIHVVAEFLGVPEYEEFLHNITSILDTRIENYISNYVDGLKLLTAGYFMAAETGWYTTADIASGTVIDIPNNFRYVVGAHHLHVIVDGIVVEQNHYTEVGDYYTYSTQFKFNDTGIKQGQHIHLTASFLGTPEYEEFMQKLNSALESIYNNTRIYAQATTNDVQAMISEAVNSNEETRKYYEEVKVKYGEVLTQSEEMIRKNEALWKFYKELKHQYEELKQKIDSNSNSEKEEPEKEEPEKEEPEEEELGSDIADSSTDGGQQPEEEVADDITEQKE